jgi:hypothetical protein
MAETRSEDGSGTVGTLHAVFRAVAALVLVLMLVAVVYSGWISIVNWADVGV